MRRILLLHTMPALYRVELFNRVAALLAEKQFEFFVIFQYLSSERRSFWGNLSERCDFKYFQSRSIRIGSSYKNIRIPLRPLREFSQISPDLIIANGFNLHTIFACIYSKIHKIPLMVWIGENKIIGFGKNIRILIRKIILKKTTHLFVYGKATRNFYQKKFNFPDSDMTALLNVIPVRHDLNIDGMIQTKIESLKEKKLRLIFVGDLKTSKGIFFIPDLLKEIDKVLKNHKIQFFVLGGGPEEENFKNLLKKIETNLEIIFFGKILNDQVLREVASSHFLLFPTLGEPWGHAITEALCLGTPVITSHFAGAVPDMIKDRENGFIADFAHPSSIISLISSLISNLDNYKSMCDCAEKSYYNIFNSLDNAQTFVDTTLKILNSN